MENTDPRLALVRLKGATEAFIEELHGLQPIFQQAAREERPLWSPWLRVSNAIAEALSEGADSVGVPANLRRVIDDQLAARGWS